MFVRQAFARNSRTGKKEQHFVYIVQTHAATSQGNRVDWWLRNPQYPRDQGWLSAGQYVNYFFNLHEEEEGRCCRLPILLRNVFSMEMDQLV